MLTKLAMAIVVLVFVAHPAEAVPSGVCIQNGDPAKVVDIWRDHFGMRAILKMDVTIGPEETVPAMILASPDGKFTVLYLHGGLVCEFIEGDGMGPAAADLQFPAEEPKPEERGG